MSKLKLIEISGDSCAGCHAMLSGLNSTAEANGMEFVRIDLETQPQAVEKYAVRKIPTVVIADGDYIIASCSGYQPDEILELWAEAKIEEYLNSKTKK